MRSGLKRGSEVGMTWRLSVFIWRQPSRIDWFILAIMCIRLKVTRRWLIICMDPILEAHSRILA